MGDGGMVRLNKSLLSNSLGHIIDHKLNSVVHAGVCRSKSGDLIWTRLVWALESTRWHATDSIPPQVSRKEF